MSLFKNRSLALLCFVFIATGVIAYKISIQAKAVGILISCLCAVICVITAFRSEKVRIKAIFCALCALSVLLSLFSQWAFVDMKREKALSYVGERTVQILVVDEVYSSDFSSEYKVLINEVDGETVSLSADLVCDFSDELNMGDSAYIKGEVFSAHEKTNRYARERDEDVYIMLEVESVDRMMILSRDNVNARIWLERLRDNIADYMDDTLGDDTSALARGFLLGDKSDMPTEVIRDFRRAGVSHLLAVSGLHLSVIMGALEFVLRRLCAPKGVRCVILSVSAVLFLALTGFAMSAFRSVVMILCVYLSYLFVRENDPITSLFVSVAVIMFMIPHSVSDVGLWLSFLATLGILSTYIPLAELWHRRSGKGIGGRIRSALEKVFFALLITFVCNTFICMVVWSVFGEMSVVSILSNPILSPVSELFTVMIPVSALMGNIPVLGDVLVWCLSVLSESICMICEAFSSVNGAVISLKYGFAGIIIIAMSLSVAVMLVVRLKHKWTVIIPPIAAVLAFAVCFGVYGIARRGKYSSAYYTDNKNDMVVVAQGYSAAVFDISSGKSSFGYGISSVVSENRATEISEYIVTHYHKSHVASVERTVRSLMVRKIYLPVPKDISEYEIMTNIAILAEEHGVEVELYESGERISLLSDIWCSVISEESERACCSVFAVFGNDEKIFSYVSKGCDSDGTFKVIEEMSDRVIRGRH